MIDVAPIVKEIRTRKSLTQKELADILGVSQGLIVKLENGGVKAPGIDLIAEMVHKLGVNVNVFIWPNEPLFLEPGMKGRDPYRQKVLRYEKLIGKLNDEMLKGLL